MKILRLVIIGLVVGSTCFVTSCQNKVAGTIHGWWTIDTLWYSNDGDIRRCLFSNSIFFNKDASCELPTTGNRCQGIETFDPKGTWKLIHTDTVPFMMNIKTKNKIFSGLHEVYFFKDEQHRLLKMVLLSDSLYMVCRKGMFDYDSHLKTINELMKQSQAKLKHKEY